MRLKARATSIVRATLLRTGQNNISPTVAESQRHPHLGGSRFPPRLFLLYQFCEFFRITYARGIPANSVVPNRARSSCDGAIGAPTSSSPNRHGPCLKSSLSTTIAASAKIGSRNSKTGLRADRLSCHRYTEV